MGLFFLGNKVLKPRMFLNQSGEPYLTFDDGRQEKCLYCNQWQFESWGHLEVNGSWVCFDCGFLNGHLTDLEYLDTCLGGVDRKYDDVIIRDGKIYIKDKKCRWPWEASLKDIRRSSRYQKWRKAVFDRDSHTCLDCLKKEKLNAHHLKSFAKYPELRYSLDNGVTVCVECHRKRHAKKAKNA